MIRHFDFYLLRRPSVSVNQLNDFHHQLSGHSPEELLKGYFSNHLAQESIFVASPALYDRFQRWLAGEKLTESHKLLITLYKYFVRSSTRSTPYGLFSGCSFGKIGAETTFKLSNENPFIRHTKIDFECLIAIKEWLIEQSSIQAQLKLFPNSSLYKVGENYRYVEEFREDLQRNYFISSIEGNDYLNLIFNLAKSGARIEDLTDLLVNADIESSEARDFIMQLIENKILVFDIETVITGPDFLQALLVKLESLQETSQLTFQLKEFQMMLDRADDRINMYNLLRPKIDRMTSSPTKQDFIQVDTFYSYSQNSIKAEVIQHIQRLLTKLMALNQPNVNPDLEEFKKRFRRRYEDEEVSLIHVLDQEIGIGYGSFSSMGASYTPMIDALTMPASGNSQKTHVVNWWQKFVLEKYTNTIRGNSEILELTDADLEDIASNQPAGNQPVGFSFYTFGNLLADSPESVDDGNFTFNLIACKGPSAVNIISRFYEESSELSRHLEKCIRQEEMHNPDVVFAEIIYCPDSRAGNIMARPSLYRYEIPYMGKSSVGTDFQIPVQDLLISVRSGKIVLRSRRLNKRVIPRLSNAHNYRTGLPIYRFLCDLQHQDSYVNIGFDWDILQDQAYLPQVKYKNIILSRASWLLQADSLNLNDPTHLAQKLKSMGVPSQFVIAAGDNELFVDSSIPFSLQLLSQTLQKEQTVRIKEFLSVPENCFLQHNGQKYASELVLPFWNDNAPPIPGLSVSAPDSPKRRFSIGSEWLYLKIYAGEKSSDTLLIQVLFPILLKLLEDQVIDKFFFIRYYDPDSHLRLRFHGSPSPDFYHHVIRAIEDSVQHHVQEGVIYKIQADMYHRELERYGMEQIELCETLFHFDSMSTLTFLHRSDGQYEENDRFLFAVKQINRLLENANLSMTERYEIMDNLKEIFFLEFSGDSTLRKQLGEKYRFFKPEMDRELQLSDTGEIFDNAHYVKQLVAGSHDRIQLFSIIHSLIHMTVNRIFPSKQRAYELIIYHCLAKHYASEKSKQFRSMS